MDLSDAAWNRVVIGVIMFVIGFVAGAYSFGSKIK